MKTVNALEKIEMVLDGEVVETVAVKNPCQVWKKMDELFAKWGNSAEMRVLRPDGTEYKHFTVKVQANGKAIRVNSVKETNRTAVHKAKAEAEAAAAKAAAKKAKRAAQNKAYRERKKAAETAAKAAEQAAVNEAV